jgi:hypothetical protein
MSPLFRGAFLALAMVSVQMIDSPPAAANIILIPPTLEGLEEAYKDLKSVIEKIKKHLDEQDRKIAEGIRQFSMDVSGSAGRAAAQVFVEEAKKFLKNDVEPLLARMETIALGEVEKVVGEANKILNRLEQILAYLLEAASGKIDQIMTRVDELVKVTGLSIDAKIDLFFATFRAEIDNAITKLDNLLKDFICAAMKNGNGLYIQGLPFAQRPDSITVWFPYEKQCFAKYYKSATSIFYADFTGFEYYEGMMCELEFEIKELDPSDSLTIPRMSSYYRELAALASVAVCHDKITRGNMIARQLQYERKAFFYDSLANGTWPLFKKYRK